MDESEIRETRNEHYRITLFGPFAVLTTEGVDATPPGRKAKALLAILALAPNGRRTRGWLKYRLWSGATEDRGSASLRQEFSALRKHFSKFRCQPLQSIGDDIVMDFSCIWVDVRDGSPDAHRELLEGMDVGDPEFEDWLSEERAYWYGRLDQSANSTPRHSSLVKEQVTARRLFPSLALHSFEAIGDLKDLNSFAVGLTEELDALLDSVSGTYRIISPRFSKEQEADFVMTGSVRGDRIFRVHARIIRLHDGTKVWNGRYDVDRCDEMHEIERTARRIIEGLQLSLSDGNWANYWAEAETTTRAWELFQKGRVREAAARRLALQDAISFYRESIKADPEFLQARISLGFCLIDGLRMCLHYAPEAAALEAAAIADDIERRAPDNFYGQALKAFVMCSNGRFGTALGIMQSVVEETPRSAELISYLAAVHGYRGDYQREQLLYRHALDLSPFPPVWIRTNLAFSLLMSNVGDPKEVLGFVLGEEPDNPRALTAETVRLVRAGAIDAARETSSRLLEIDPDFRARRWRSKAFTLDRHAHRKIAHDLRTAGLD